ncbi:hypothetical protein C8R43DRAFT_1231861 [Mycena crocata]|nr:hypothetical protein C8R43DRAFT_1231861 [Mycena crocata]
MSESPMPGRVSDLCYYVPAKSMKGGPDDPQLILIFGWMDATVPQLMRHSAKHSAAYPAANHLLIQSQMASIVTGSREANIKRQTPILGMLRRLGFFDESPPRILLHVFSSGGVAQLLWLALAFEGSPRNPIHTRPATCLILDSTPGGFRVSDLQRVLTVSLTGFQKLAGTAMATLLAITLKGVALISGRPTAHDFIRDGLNNPSILPWMDRTTPRLYLYSDVDQLSLATDVNTHIVEGKAEGLNIREELFLDSPHLLHSKMYPERYWGAIHSRWRDAVRSKL